MGFHLITRLRVAGIAVLVALSCSLPSCAHASPYEGTVNGQIKQLWTLLDQSGVTDNLDYEISPIKLEIAVAEFGKLNIVFKTRSDSTTNIFKLKNGNLNKISEVISTTLTGNITYRSKGKKVVEEVSASFSRHRKLNTLRILTGLPRPVSGKYSQYSIRIKEDQNIARIFRVPASKVTNFCGIEASNTSNASRKTLAASSSTLSLFKFTAIVDQAFQSKAGGSSSAGALIDSLISNSDRTLRSYAGFQITRENIILLSGTDDSSSFQTTDADAIIREIQTKVSQGKFGTGNIFHLFTGKGTTLSNCGGDVAVGCALVGGTCSNGGKNYGVLVHLTDAVLAVAATHELGHNLGANHDSNTYNGRQTIMYPAAEASNFGFSDTSVSEMEQSRSCAAVGESTTPTPVPSTTPTVTSDDKSEGDSDSGGGGSSFFSSLFGIIKSLFKIFTFGFGSQSVTAPYQMAATKTEYAYLIEVSRGPKYVEGVECKVRLDLTPSTRVEWQSFNIGKTDQRYFKYEFPLSSKPVTDAGKPISLKMRVGFKCDDGSKYIAPTFKLTASHMRGQKKPYKKWIKELRSKLGQYGDEIFD